MKQSFLLFGILCLVVMSFSSFVGRRIEKRTTLLPTVTEASNPYYIIIDKSDYELKVFDNLGWYATYPIVFGSKDLSDKLREGDRRTPRAVLRLWSRK